MAKKSKKTAKKKTTTKKKSASKKTAKKAKTSDSTTKKKTKKKKTSTNKVAKKKTTAKKKAVSKRKSRRAHVAPVLRTSPGLAQFADIEPLTKSPLSEKQIEYFKQLLLIKRAELLGDVSSMEAEALRNSRMDATGDLSSMPIHMADIGSDNFEQEFSLGLVDGERKLLREIHDALLRINEGTYGICEGTGQAIPLARLEASPWARYCIQYQELVEKGLIEEGEKTYDEEELENKRRDEEDTEDDDTERIDYDEDLDEDEDEDEMEEDDFDPDFFIELNQED